MTICLNLAKITLFTVLFGLMTACSQTATTTYGGGIGSSSIKSANLRQQKIAGARKRAKAAKAGKKAAFLKKRQERLSQKNKGRKAKKAHSKTASYRARKNKKRRSRSNRRKKKSYKRRAHSKKRKSKKRHAYVARTGRKMAKMRTNAPWRCVPSRLKRVISQVRKRYGRVTINSTYRSKRKNRRVGGKRRSYHLHCNAIDFRVHGRTRGLTRYLARHPSVGGWKRYPSGYYHIDTGPKRTW